MTNHEKAMMYDDLLRQSDILQRVNSKLKSEYPINMPPHIEEEIKKNNEKINGLVNKLQSLLM